MTVLIGFAGFSIDLGNWYLNAQRLQRSADASALAGATFMPGNFPQAKKTAQTIFKANSPADAGITVNQVTARPTLLEVATDRVVPNYFISMFGLDTIHLTRSAVAEYSPYTPMGSPSNVLGKEYRSSDSWEKSATKGNQDGYWLNIVGQQTDKAQGDRYSSGDCTTGIYNCSTSKPIPSRNEDYTDGEQVFVLRVPKGVSGTLVVQAFDATFAHVGQQCEDPNLIGATTYDGGTGLYKPNNTPQCTGDIAFGEAPTTNFTMYTPELTGGGGSQPVTTPGCQTITFPGFVEDTVNGIRIKDKVNPASPYYDAFFKASFRKWYPICKMYVDGSSQNGDYLLHVKVPNTNANGINRYALRAGIQSAGGSVIDTSTSQLELFSKGRLVIYTREGSQQVVFYLARVITSGGGNRMLLSLYDIGESAVGAKLQVKPPAGATVNGVPLTNFTDCKYTKPGVSYYVNTDSNCTITGMKAGTYNGVLVNIDIGIPSGYACNDADPNACWTRMTLDYGGGSVNDTTSWEVTVTGNPVHLVVR